MKKLVIVESPAKSKTISKILGDDYIVTASVGHIRDLPTQSLGIRISEDGLNFKPVYEVADAKKKVVAGLVKSAKACDEVYLASDPDREGEAIAWHIKAVIEGASKNPVEGRKFHRIRYNEITPAAVRKAFETPGEIDERVVDAQQARRVLDRLVGFKISRVLWRKVRTGISAGRVQSVGLRLVCERELAVRAFVPVPYWEFDVALSKPGAGAESKPFKSRLTQIDGKKAEIGDEARAEEIKKALESGAFEVASVTEQRRSRKPFAPFITSTLQQSASNALGFSPKLTMSIAQKLYEGVDLGGDLGQTGLITYMRTDSFSVSNEARDAAKLFIVGSYGAEYHNEKERVYKNRDNAQGAHEAIRPTDPGLTPDKVAAKLTPQEAKLYDLIWRRFIASRMSDAVSNVRMVKIAATPESKTPAMTLSASSSELVFPGFTKVYGAAEQKQNDDAENGGEGDAQGLQAWLPPLAKGEALERGAVAGERKETKPPPRFNEASLVKELEANGIGRPSTYASILSILLTRKYMVKDKRALVPTDLGMEVNEYLCKHYDKLFDIGFTAEMENELDDVENPEKSLDWQGMLSAFYRRLMNWLGASAVSDAADPDAFNSLIAMFENITEWEPRRKIGMRTYDDKQFVESVKKTGAARASRQQFESLARMLLRYKGQVKDAETFLQSIGVNLAESEDGASPLRNNATRIFEILEKAGVNESSAQFFQSLRTQHEIGRRLSDKQLACLERMYLESGERIEGFGPELNESLGITRADAANRPASASKTATDSAPDFVPDPAETLAMLSGLAQVGTWKKPVKRGRVTYDDVKFFQSLSAQFAVKKRLSEAQIKSLRRLFISYKDKIADADSVIKQYNLTIPPKKKQSDEE